MERNSETTAISTGPTTRAMTGTTTTSRRDSPALSLTAMITPPTLVMTAGTSRVSAIWKNSWTC
jgi:hypothetical protein